MKRFAALIALLCVSTCTGSAPAFADQEAADAIANSMHAAPVVHVVQVKRHNHTPAQTVRRRDDESSPPILGGDLISTARQYLGTNPTGWAHVWCGNFMRLLMRVTGHPDLSSGNSARAWASYGHPLGGPQVGAIAVLARGRHGGHVGIVTAVIDRRHIRIVSGNHGHRVGEGVYPTSLVIAYRAP